RKAKILLTIPSLTQFPEVVEWVLDQRSIITDPFFRFAVGIPRWRQHVNLRDWLIEYIRIQNGSSLHEVVIGQYLKHGIREGRFDFNPDMRLVLRALI